MIMNESNFDLYIHDLLTSSKIHADYQHTEIIALNEALKTASKSQTGEKGMPDFIAVVKGFYLVIEDKADQSKLCLRDENGNISQTIKATREFAVNGAVFYARRILDSIGDAKIFAFGNAGDAKHHALKPVYIDSEKLIELDEIETFENFSHDNIENYYRVNVQKETLPEAVERVNLNKKAAELHEHLRNYGSLGETEKPLVVSAILLALREKNNGFSINQLTGDEERTDGEKIYDYLVSSLKRAKVSPQVKLQKVLNQFTLIKDRPILNAKHHDLEDKTPLRYFTEYINDHIYNALNFTSTHEDYLGMFYGEFVRYSGGDGQSLGVVLTPPHITELFCELLNLKPDDVIFDPCCGTGGFLIAGMHRMLASAESESQRRHIKAKQIYGIELRDDMFSIATTNMILRGDGQSNLTCENFFAKNPADLQLLGITAGFMNPPYSQAKNTTTANLSELSFTRHLLESVLPGGRVAVIVPVSAMVGKTKYDKIIKSDILRHHTLEGVISLNKNTFYGIGTVPCIAVFTAGEKHPEDKLVKFINFEDDGYELKKHLGLVETERAKDRKQYLIDCWTGKIKDYPSKFMVETI